MDKVRGPNSKLVTNGPEAQKDENKHSSPDKIGRLQRGGHLICTNKNYGILSDDVVFI